MGPPDDRRGGAVPDVHGHRRLMLRRLAPLAVALVVVGLLALALPDRESWPALATRHGLHVGADERWTGVRDPRWFRVDLPGPPVTPRHPGRRGRLPRWDVGSVAGGRSGSGADLTLYTLAADRGLPGSELWLALAEQHEFDRSGPRRGAGSVAQLVALPPTELVPGPLRATGRKPRRPLGPGVPLTLLVVGAEEGIPFQLPRSTVEPLAHLLQGRVVLLDGAAVPAPVLEQRAFVQGLDGLQVYTDEAAGDPGLAEAGEAAYRRAISYGGGAQRLAALGGSVRPREADGAQRPATLVRTLAADTDGLRDGLDSCRTVAVIGLPDLVIDLPQLGQLHQGAAVELELRLNRPVERIELWREQERVEAWLEVDAVRHVEQLAHNAAFSFKIIDQGGVALSSGIWYEPHHVPRPDLTIQSRSPSWEEGRAQAVVHNQGDAPARHVQVDFFDQLPFSGQAAAVGSVEVDLLAPGSSLLVESLIDAPPPLLYVRAGSALAQGRPHPEEAELRNNAAFRALHGVELRRWELAGRLRQRRLQLRE